MLNRLRNLFSREDTSEAPLLGEEPRRLDGVIRAPETSGPIELDLGGRRLRLYAETRLNHVQRPPADWLLVDGDRYLREISGFMRIRDGETVLIGRANETCQRLFEFPAEVRRRHLEIRNRGGRITLKRLDPEGETTARVIAGQDELPDPEAVRLRNLERLRGIFGGPIELLPPETALANLRQVNEILQNEAHRPKDSQGRPGGLVELPRDLIPIVVGDLHAMLDNFLKVLCEDAHLDALCRGDACLILLGDTIHPEGDDELEQMDSSLVMLDLIFKLKLLLPRNLFYLRGNHESFGEGIGKGGVPQGLVFRRRARELRGESYVDELARFFAQLPYVLVSDDLVACHAGPPRGDFERRQLVEIRENQDLAAQLIWNRLRRPNYPAGYNKRDVKRFRANLGVYEETPVLVSHSPLSRDETLWTDVGEIDNHHILFSANPDQLAVFVRAGANLVPQVYPAERLLELANALESGEAKPAHAG